MGGSKPPVSGGRRVHKHTEFDDGVGVGGFSPSDSGSFMPGSNPDNSGTELGMTAVLAGASALAHAAAYGIATTGAGDEAFEFQRWVESYVDPVKETAPLEEDLLLSEELTADVELVTESEILADLEGFAEVMLEAVEVLAIL